METARLSTPLGPIEIVGSSSHIFQVRFVESSQGTERASPLSKQGAVECCVQQLLEYFQKKRHHFDLPLDPQGTNFQKKVWLLLQAIPFGQTATYGEIAKTLGQPKAARAVGGANHHNPIALIIPCHRIIGAQGALTGYACGLSKKEWLLKHEAL